MLDAATTKTNHFIPSLGNQGGYINNGGCNDHNDRISVLAMEHLLDLLRRLEDGYQKLQSAQEALEVGKSLGFMPFLNFLPFSPLTVLIFGLTGFEIIRHAGILTKNRYENA